MRVQHNLRSIDKMLPDADLPTLPQSRGIRDNLVTVVGREGIVRKERENIAKPRRK